MLWIELEDACHRDFRRWSQEAQPAPLSRYLNCQYKTVFVPAHKLGEAIGSQLETREIAAGRDRRASKKPELCSSLTLRQGDASKR